MNIQVLQMLNLLSLLSLRLSGRYALRLEYSQRLKERIAQYTFLSAKTSQSENTPPVPSSEHKRPLRTQLNQLNNDKLSELRFL